MTTLLVLVLTANMYIDGLFYGEVSAGTAIGWVLYQLNAVPIEDP